MGVREDFVSLFRDHEDELEKLPVRFPLKDFSYMYTSQRTMERIQEKLNQVVVGGITGRPHGNFWVDLRNMGLAKIGSDEISEFGLVVLEYFNGEEDSFKREHFILSGIKQKAFDVSDEIYEGYIQKVEELKEFISKIPSLNQEGKELLDNHEKLLITGFLNVFPFALNHYFKMSEDRQKAIDSLHESGLKLIFPSSQHAGTVYYKIANRLWNIWRVPHRRVNFVKSVVLSEYEKIVELNSPKKTPFRVINSFSKILNEGLLIKIIKESDTLQVIDENGIKFIEQRSFSLPSLPPTRKAKRTHKIKKRRRLIRRRITSAKQLRVEVGNGETRITVIDPEGLELRNELIRERNQEHQEIVIKFWKFYFQKGIHADENNFDLLVERNNTVLLHEMKTITENNERIQVIKAIGQLFYYEYFEMPLALKSDNVKIIKMAVFQNKLNDELHIDYLRSLGIYVYWINEDGEIDGENESMDFLMTFVGS